MGRKRKNQAPESVSEEAVDSGLEEQGEAEQLAPPAYTLIRPGAFGYGTRQAGFVFATEVNGEVVPAEGVSPTEVETLLNNPQFFEIR